MTLDKTLTVDEDGLHLPDKYAAGDPFVIRTPRVTINSTKGTDSQIFGGVLPTDWIDDVPYKFTRNPRAYDEGLVGLKLHGGDQEWYPVEVDADS